jgi:DNA polymerase-3 subunit delta'
LSWQTIRGHDALIQSFRRAVQRGRLAHAYLFAGPPGVGKYTFARELAKALLCEGRSASDEVLTACDDCPSCIQVEAGTHPDYYYATRSPESHEFRIDLMRELCHGFALKSARGKGKVVLIDDADDLNEESANCFLKTLEEPPSRSILILISSSLDRQLRTVVSRCQVIRFAPLPLPLVEEILRSRPVGDEQTLIPPELLPRLARLSDGSPGLALKLADPALWEFRQTFLLELTRMPLDNVALSQGLVEFVESAGKESAALRGRARLVLRLLIDFLGDALALSQQGSARRTEADDRPLLDALAGRAGLEALLGMLERCLEADRQIERRLQLVLVLEGLMDALAQKLA